MATQQMAAVVVVVAVGPGNEFGTASGAMPWPRDADDLAHFKATTAPTTTPGMCNAVVMGRKTYESLPKRPLPGRLAIVVSTTLRQDDGVVVVPSLRAALTTARANPLVETAFVIGGAALVQQALWSGVADRAVVTRMTAASSCPDLVYVDTGALATPLYTRVAVKDDKYEWYSRCRTTAPHDEFQYLALVQEILDTGVRRDDRTGVGTLAVFGRQMRFSLTGGTLPLLTTKRVFWRGVAEELLWFISGCTDAKVLSAKGVAIWDANASRAFLDGRGLTAYAEGDLGPVYGFQWRHFGAAYCNSAADYVGQGVDQLRNVIAALRSNPHDRRILMSAWNPCDLDKMALPPCHVLCQFLVAPEGLVCVLYQRSADMGLGVPFNIASYALLTHLVAHVCGLAAKELVVVLGDAHVYRTHVAALREQVTRTPAPFPTLAIDAAVADIDDCKLGHLTLTGYRPQGGLAMPLAV